MGELYQLFFPESGKSYIGITTKTAIWRYSIHKKMVTGKRNYPLYNAWRKYGDPSLSILAVLENDELAGTEIRAIRAFKTLAPNGYNLSLGGELAPSKHPLVAQKISKSLTGKKLSQATKDKIGAIHKGKTLSDKHKAAISKRHKGTHLSEERKRKLVEANKKRTYLKGWHHTAETCRIISESQRGKKRSPEAIENMRKAITGRHLSEEHKEKIRLAGIGRKFSPESIAKMKAYEFSDDHRASLSLSARGNKNGTGNCNSRPVLDTKTGEVFICAALAAKTRGIKRTTLHNWLNDISIPKNEAPDRYCYARSDS